MHILTLAQNPSQRLHMLEECILGNGYSMWQSLVTHYHCMRMSIPLLQILLWVREKMDVYNGRGEERVQW